MKGAVSGMNKKSTQTSQRSIIYYLLNCSVQLPSFLCT